MSATSKISLDGKQCALFKQLLQKITKDEKVIPAEFCDEGYLQMGYYIPDLFKIDAICKELYGVKNLIELKGKVLSDSEFYQFYWLCCDSDIKDYAEFLALTKRK